MKQFKRRTFLGATGVGTATLLAGCSGLPGGSDPAYTSWVPASMDERPDEQLRIEYIELGSVLDNWSNEQKQEWDTGLLAREDEFKTFLDEREELLGIGVDDIEYILDINSGSSSILVASFDTDDVVSRLEDEHDETATEENSYYVINDRAVTDVIIDVAVTDDAIITSREYGALIEAKAGDRELLFEENDQWKKVSDELDTGEVVDISYGTFDDELVIWGDAATAGDDTIDIQGVDIYETEDAAEESVEMIEEWAEDDPDVKINSLEVDGEIVLSETTLSGF